MEQILLVDKISQKERGKVEIIYDFIEDLLWEKKVQVVQNMSKMFYVDETT